MRPFVDRIADGNGIIDNFVLSQLLKTMVGTALQPAIELVPEMVRRAVAAGQIHATSALLAGDISLFAVEVDRHHQVMAIEDPRMGFLFAIDLDNRIDEEALNDERVMQKIFNLEFNQDAFIAAQLAKFTKPARVSIHRYHSKDPRSFERAVTAVRTGGYSSGKLFSVSPAFQAQPENESDPKIWFESSCDLNSCDWQDPFRLLRSALQAHGLIESWEDRSRSVAARIFNPRSVAGLEKYDAADELARLLASKDNHLLGDRAAALLQAIQDISNTNQFAAAIPTIDFIIDHCLSYLHIDPHSSFRHNDGDHLVYARRLDRGDTLLVLGDHNRDYVVFVEDKDSTVPRVIRAATFGRESAIGLDRAIEDICAWRHNENSICSFIVVRGVPDCEWGPSLLTDRIRAWNGLISTIETAHACLTDEYPAPKSEMAP